MKVETDDQFAKDFTNQSSHWLHIRDQNHISLYILVGQLLLGWWNKNKNPEVHLSQVQEKKNEWIV